MLRTELLYVLTTTYMLIKIVTRELGRQLSLSACKLQLQCKKGVCVIIIPASGSRWGIWASLASLLRQSSEFQTIQRFCLKKERKKRNKGKRRERKRGRKVGGT